MRARDNPFRSERLLTVRYLLQGIGWPELLHRCASLQYRAALVGPYGSGKTTLLEDLEVKLRESGRHTRLVRLPSDQESFNFSQVRHLLQGLSRQDILLLDSCERLNVVAWQWLRWQARHIGGLIITAHHPGRLPTLWECRTSPRLLASIVAQLLGSPLGALGHSTELLFGKHQGNLRNALRECYDLLAETSPLNSEDHPLSQLYEHKHESLESAEISLCSRGLGRSGLVGRS